MSKQSTSHLFMIEPESFYSNEQTAFTNHYQEQVTDETPEIIAEKALAEFHGLKNAIEDKGIKVTSLKGSKDCPDHIFPNWFITFDDKTMQIFSMMAPNRRKEKKPSMIEHLTNTYELTDDMSYLEDKEVFLESTSSMVFDRVNRIVYAGISPRTNAVQLIICTSIAVGIFLIAFNNGYWISGTMEGHAAALANLDMVNGDVDISPGSQAFIENNASNGNIIGTVGAYLFYVGGLLLAVLPLWMNPED